MILNLVLIHFLALVLRIYARVAVVITAGGLSRRLRRGSGPPEVEAQFRLALALRSDFAVDLFGVVAAFGDGLRAGFQAGLDLQDLRRSILGRVDPVPLGRKPVAGEPGAPVGGICPP